MIKKIFIGLFVLVIVFFTYAAYTGWSEAFHRDCFNETEYLEKPMCEDFGSYHILLMLITGTSAIFIALVFIMFSPGDKRKGEWVFVEDKNGKI